MLLPLPLYLEALKVFAFKCFKGIMQIHIIKGFFMKKTRNRKITKKQMTARININLIARIDTYIEGMNLKGLSIKKVDIIERALFEYMEKLENEK